MRSLSALAIAKRSLVSDDVAGACRPAPAGT